jgi:hypothetical protein
LKIIKLYLNHKNIDIRITSLKIINDILTLYGPIQILIKENIIPCIRDIVINDVEYCKIKAIKILKYLTRSPLNELKYLISNEIQIINLFCFSINFFLKNDDLFQNIYHINYDISNFEMVLIFLTID